jgi:formylglycine-generating enzyme required for sulfatase activity/dienelactone hydrolase
VDTAIELCGQIADALACAHAGGIVHRDIKPGNIFITTRGDAKVLDFGLAKHAEAIAADGETFAGTGNLTQAGTTLGTVAYMSPEQAEAKAVDARSDVFSLGAVLYELLAGRRPFQGDSPLSTLAAVMRDNPAPLKDLRRDIPAELARVVARCLEKDRAARYRSGQELADELRRCREALSAPRAGVLTRTRRAPLLLATMAALVVVTAVVVWFALGAARAGRTQRALSEVASFIEQEKYSDALRVARQAGLHLKEDPQTRQLLGRISVATSIRTEPDGADVYVKDYLSVDRDWEHLGKAPILNVLLPLGQLRWKVEKSGWETSDKAGFVLEEQRFVLEPADAATAGMVRVPGGAFRFGSTMALDEYWLDRYEVTNREFKRFVDAGGYAQRTHWKHPFVKDGRTLPWDEAMRELRDATGRPGPATWQLGTYPDGQEDFPVGGVSWYEAAAYADFAGRSLPTVYHWYRAAQGVGNFSEILQLSNFGGQGPARRGQYLGLAPFGTYDMAGNVAEWCWNATGDRRFVLGGSWSDAPYMFERENAQPPFARPPAYGFRTASYPSRLPDTLTRAVDRLGRDYAREKPVDERVFRVFRGVYDYTDTPLEATVESVEESEHWRQERVSVAAAYGGERVIALLFLPKQARPPYQTVVYFPTSVALLTPSVGSSELLYLDFLVRAGRAVLYPIYKGMYERRVKSALSGLALERDLVIPWSKDLGRAIDYLETREDIDRGRLAFYGFSLGARYGPLLTAIEPRLKVSVLLAGGFSREELAPEVDPFHFAPRATQPVLMLNGRDDFMRPVETSQLPLFRMLGAPEKDKRHVLYDAGHSPPRLPAIKEILEWLDRYLGPVSSRFP